MSVYFTKEESEYMRHILWEKINRLESAYTVLNRNKSESADGVKSLITKTRTIRQKIK